MQPLLAEGCFFLNCDILWHFVIYPLMASACSYDWYLALDIIVWNKGKQILEVMSLRHLERMIEISFVLTSSLLFLGNHIPWRQYLNWFLRISCLLFSQVWPRDKPLDIFGPYVSSSAGGWCRRVWGKSVCGWRIRRGQPMEHGWALSTRHEHLAARGTYEHSSERSR